MSIACDRCRTSNELQLWVRVYPVQDRVRICQDCADAVRRDADERGLDGEDTQRLNIVAANLGGDVWRNGERVYWFRWPIGVKSNGHAANGHSTNGNGTNGHATAKPAALVRRTE